MAVYTPVSLPSKYQYIRMKDMLRSALGAPPTSSNNMYSAGTPSDSMGSNRNMGMGMMGAPGSATEQNFPNSAGSMGFGAPLSAGLDGSSGMGQNARRRARSLCRVAAGHGRFFRDSCRARVRSRGRGVWLVWGRLSGMRRMWRVGPLIGMMRRTSIRLWKRGRRGRGRVLERLSDFAGSDMDGRSPGLERRFGYG
jgi:hypothetical protein